MKTQGTMAFYHANGRGAGCAVKIELHPANAEAEGCVRVVLAPQKDAGTIPEFDWTNTIDFRLSPVDVARVLEVLRGVAESLEDGKGIFHRTRNASKAMRFYHVIEPRPGYCLEVFCKSVEGEECAERRLLFSTTEAFAVALALESSMGRLAFGD